MARYTVVLFADPDGGYTAAIPALPGCVTEGETLEETLGHAREAIQLYLESAAAHGEEVLEERNPPVIANVEVPRLIRAVSR